MTMFNSSSWSTVTIIQNAMSSCALAAAALRVLPVTVFTNSVCFPFAGSRIFEKRPFLAFVLLLYSMSTHSLVSAVCSSVASSICTRSAYFSTFSQSIKDPVVCVNLKQNPYHVNERIMSRESSRLFSIQLARMTFIVKNLLPGY